MHLTLSSSDSLIIAFLSGMLNCLRALNRLNHPELHRKEVPSLMKFIVIFVILPNKQVKQFCKVLLALTKLAIKKALKRIASWLSD